MAAGRWIMARQRPWKEMGKFGRRDWIPYAAAVLVAAAGLVVWFTSVSSTGNELPDVLIGAAITAASLPAVLTVGVGLFRKSKGWLLLEDPDQAARDAGQAGRDHPPPEDHSRGRREGRAVLGEGGEAGNGGRRGATAVATRAAG